jgi:hypothetical protein
MAQQVGWAVSPTLAASRAKARLAWLGLTGVPRSVRNTRSSWTGRGGRPGSIHRSPTVAGCPTARRSRSCWRRWARSAWTANGGRARIALLAADFSGPTASSLRLPPEPLSSGRPRGRRWSAVVPAVLPGNAMACAAGAALGDQGRGAAHVAPRGPGAAASGEPPAGGLGRPCGAGWAGPAAAPPELEQVVRPARDAAALASRPGPTPLELPRAGVAARL